MRKIQAQPITHESWILQEWGNRLGVLTCDAAQWHLISREHKLLNQSLEQIQTHLNAELEFVQPDVSDSAEDADVAEIEGLPVKHPNPCNVQLSPRISYTKTTKSVIRHAAGYWIIQFDTGHSGVLCPKCSTLDAYAHEGPFAHRLEMITILNKLRKET